MPGFRFRVKCIASVLSGLNVTCHLFDQLVILLISFVKISAAVIGSSIIINSDVSSANRRIFALILSTISLIYIRKSKGPRTDPCGTPANTGFNEDVWPFINTF